MEKTNINFDGNTFVIKTPSSSRKLKIPEDRKKQRGKNAYWFETKTVNINCVKSLPYSKAWQTAPTMTTKRIWNSFWSEGWR
jgi:hypothetical protein